MATYLKNENVMVTCPYDRAHRLLQSRLQAHIAKCSRNHPQREAVLKRCPFNAQHMIEISLFNYHLMNCENRLSLDKQLARGVYENELSRGRTAVPSYSQPLPVSSSENWDNDIDTSGSAGYIPRGPVSADGLIGDLGMMTISERKKVYQHPDLLVNEFDNRSNAIEPKIKMASPPESTRQPKLNAESAFKSTKLGAAQGDPCKQPEQPTPTIMAAADYQPVSKTAVDTRSLGIGRGRALPSRSTAAYEDNFPALG